LHFSDETEGKFDCEKEGDEGLGMCHLTFSHFFVYRHCSFGLAIQTKWSVDCLKLHSVFHYCLLNYQLNGRHDVIIA
jgi:hypothetical protein